MVPENPWALERESPIVSLSCAQGFLSRQPQEERMRKPHMAPSPLLLFRKGALFLKKRPLERLLYEVNIPKNTFKEQVRNCQIIPLYFPVGFL